MNNCILMAEIVQEPELRYTSENNMAITQMLVQFPATRAEDPPATLRVVSFGNLATEIQQKYHQGDRVILEGRLSMSTVEREEGFKEKRAELTLQRIHSLDENFTFTSTAAPAAELHTTATRSTSSPARADVVKSMDIDEEYTLPQPQPTVPKVPAYQSPSRDIDVDDIPF